MAQENPYINGEAYAWSHVDVSLLGLVIEGVKSIKYKKKVGKPNHYGRGTKPVAYTQQGKEEFEGSITISFNELKKVLTLLPKGKSLTDIAPFPITVSYALNETDPGMTDAITYVRFTEDNREASEGDDELVTELPFECYVTMNI